MSHAVIVVDVQNDYVHGSLPVPGAGRVVPRIVELMRRAQHHFVVATRDRHIDPGDHFSPDPDFRRSWPVHCLDGTWGAELEPAIAGERIDEIFDKGQYGVAYSGFEARAADGTGLARWLQDRCVQTVDVVGLATDYCVAATALDACRAGLATSVPLDLTAGVARDTCEEVCAALSRAGVRCTGRPVVA